MSLVTVPSIQRLNSVSSKCIENTDKMGQSCFPRTELEFVHEVGNKHWVKVKTELRKFLRERILTQIVLHQLVIKWIQAKDAYPSGNQWHRSYQVLDPCTDDTSTSFEYKFTYLSNEWAPAIIIYSNSFFPLPSVCPVSQSFNLILINKTTRTGAPSKKFDACKKNPKNEPINYDEWCIKITHFSG